MEEINHRNFSLRDDFLKRESVTPADLWEISSKTQNYVPLNKSPKSSTNMKP